MLLSVMPPFLHALKRKSSITVDEASSAAEDSTAAAPGRRRGVQPWRRAQPPARWAQQAQNLGFKVTADASDAEVTAVSA